MSDRRRARRAKQSRRDVRRAKKRDEESPADTTFRDAVRRALGRHPLGLLSIASLMIDVAKPDSLTSPEGDGDYLDRILPGLIDTRNRETTALLAVIGELLVDDPEPQLQCRREVDERGEHLPRWIGALSRVEVYRAVRRTYVFGDVDELVVGMRLEGGHELTVGVRIDHNMLSSVVDAAAVKDPIDEALAWASRNEHRHFCFRDDAGRCADLDRGCAQQADTCARDGDLAALPSARSVAGRPAARGRRAPVTGRGSGVEREALQHVLRYQLGCAVHRTRSSRDAVALVESGTGDPLRWSEARVERAISVMPYFGDRFPLDVVLDAPDLLRAFIPFAHAQSGIRDELTSRTLAAIDELRSNYKRDVLKKADYWWLDDAG